MGSRQVPSKVIAVYFAPKLVLKGRLFRPKEIIFGIEKKYGININYDKALTAFHKAYNFIHGEHSKSWQLMPGYFHLLKKENPGLLLLSKGMLFIVVTKDYIEQVFTLAFGLADKEKDESRVWFMQQMYNAFGCRNNLVIVSDGHQSIKNAVQRVFGAIHAICTFHL